MNDELPAWAYRAFTVAKLIPLRKAASGPDVRPIGVCEELRKLWLGALIDDSTPAIASVLTPVQLGVGIPRGGSCLTLGARLLLEARPDFAALSIDLVNAHNAGWRRG